MKLAASSIYRYMKCPGSAHLEETIPKELRFNAFKDAASFGREVHHAGELYVTPLADKKQKVTITQALKGAGIDKHHKRYDDAKYIVGEYKKHFKKVVSGMGKRKHEILIEDKFRACVNDVDLVFKADGLVIGGDRDRLKISFIDLKTGNWDYSESAVEQMYFSLEVLLADRKYKDTTEIDINLYISQPFYFDETKHLIRFNETSTVGALRAGLQKRVNRIKTGSSTFCTGSHCAMCPAILMCPNKHAYMNLLDKFQELAAEGIEALSPEKLEFIWLQSSAFSSFLKAVDQRIAVMMETGCRFDGLYRKQSYGKRKWIDEKKVARRLKHLGSKIYEEPKLKSPAQTEKLAGKVNIEELYTKPEIFKLAEIDKDAGEVF